MCSSIPDNHWAKIRLEALDERWQGGSGGGDVGVPGPIAHVIDGEEFASTGDVCSPVLVRMEVIGAQLGEELPALLGVWRLRLMAKLGAHPGRW